MFDGYYDEAHQYIHGGMGGAGSFAETFRCYSVAMMPTRSERPELLYGGKIVMPQSALTKLSALHISWPMLFQLTNPAHERVTHSGVLEFTAEEGRVYVPQWMMQTLLLEEGQFVQIKNVELPLGTFVKIQPQSVDFLDITDPKAVLEQALRNFSTLTEGDIITFKYNDKLFDILVMETKPAGKGISIVETDLEVDFAAPLGYQEPAPVARSTPTPSMTGSTTRIAEHTIAEEIGFVPFGGSGQRLSGKIPVTSLDASSGTNGTPIPAALRLPPGKLFFGYPVVPLKPKNTNAEPDAISGTTFTGQGQTLKAARRGGGTDSSGAGSASGSSGPSSSGPK
ncbi:hypothetical protein SpCBS45565_g02167 [Spizellomyces sp. 'palustris']|nr:hypothetical protein SpCBS45565_g02167 [Spizellomyces sp. 'palustris']